jgi:hypothetical protein
LLLTGFGGVFEHHKPAAALTPTAKEKVSFQVFGQGNRLLGVSDGLAIDLEDHVTGTDPGAVADGFGIDIGDERAADVRGDAMLLAVGVVQVFDGDPVGYVLRALSEVSSQS